MSFSQPVASSSKRSLSFREPSLTPSEFDIMADYPSEVENATDYKYWNAKGRFQFRQYLATARLPLFIAIGKPDIQYLHGSMERAVQWPKFRSLPRLVGTRTLRVVHRITPWFVTMSINEKLEDFKAFRIANDPPVQGEPQLLRLRLPAPGLTYFDEDDVQTLSQVRNEDDLFLLVKRYVLDTATEACRFMHRLPLKSPLAEWYKFKPANRLCPAHHARWDIFAMGGNADVELPLIVIFVPPWEFGTKDFEQLVEEKKVASGALDTLDTSDYIAADYLWAIAYDVLKGRGRKFIFTNYVRWAFGIFSEDYTESSITEVRQALLSDFTGNSIPILQNGPNILEHLVFWMDLSFPSSN